MPTLSFGDNGRCGWINYGLPPFVLFKKKVMVGQWTLETQAVGLYLRGPSFLGNEGLSSQNNFIISEISTIFESRVSTRAWISWHRYGWYIPSPVATSGIHLTFLGLSFMNVSSQKNKTHKVVWPIKTLWLWSVRMLQSHRLLTP